jgi:antitoxin (DNA-binding transcriptional repressor) of toxin-antitoxin stability system
MRSVTFTEFRKNASILISEVENGEMIQLIRHGKPVAEISPIQSEETKIPSWKKAGLRLTTKGESLSKAILEEREIS